MPPRISTVSLMNSNVLAMQHVNLEFYLRYYSNYLSSKKPPEFDLIILKSTETNFCFLKEIIVHMRI